MGSLDFGRDRIIVMCLMVNGGHSREPQREKETTTTTGIQMTLIMGRVPSLSLSRCISMAPVIRYKWHKIASNRARALYKIVSRCPAARAQLKERREREQ